MIVDSLGKVFEAYDWKSQHMHFIAISKLYDQYLSYPYRLRFVNLDGGFFIGIEYMLHKVSSLDRVCLISFASWVFVVLCEEQKLVVHGGVSMMTKDLLLWIKIARYIKGVIFYDEVVSLSYPEVDYYFDQKYIIQSTKGGYFISWYGDILLG